MGVETGLVVMPFTHVNTVSHTFVLYVFELHSTGKKKTCTVMSSRSDQVAHVASQHSVTCLPLISSEMGSVILPLDLRISVCVCVCVLKGLSVHLRNTHDKVVMAKCQVTDNG